MQWHRTFLVSAIEVPNQNQVAATIGPDPKQPSGDWRQSVGSSKAGCGASGIGDAAHPISRPRPKREPDFSQSHGARSSGGLPVSHYRYTTASLASAAEGPGIALSQTPLPLMRIQSVWI